ncbi:probable inactive serine/threonine-protein kinase scy2 [Sipha flava]|uniref:Probable inactive serine/threonine-protein kinase scy2 n=1 Tax=Sipha flava TaxID=143950 RepID=A0A8B8GBJ4_9HEMI|nr:probable inactive serine/threonine-protein kinase scy2 [Sipha flava]
MKFKMPNANNLLNMLYQESENYLENPISYTCKPSDLPVRSHNPPPLTEQHNSQSLLPTQLKPTTPIEKKQLSVVESSPETSDKLLKKPPHFTATLQTPPPITEKHNSKSLLPSQIKPTTSKYQQASTQKRPFSVVELSPETWDKSLKKPPHFTTTLQSTSPITEQHNSKSLLPAQIKHSRSKNQQASIQKKLLSSVKFLPEPPKKLNYQTFTTVANNSSLYNNYVKQESSNSNCAKTASTGYNFNQSHQIKSLTMSQPVFTSATATFGRSLQHHNKYQALRQTPTPLIKLYNAQSPLPTQPKPTTLKYQQVSNQKTPFSAVELLPATSKEILSQPSHVFATDDQSSYHNFTHNKYYNVEYDNRYDTNQNNYFITGSDLNLNWSLNVNSLENGESGKYNRLLEYGDESYGMYSGGNNNNFHLFDDPEPQSTFAKNFETLNSYTNDIHEHVSIENKRMMAPYRNLLTAVPVGSLGPDNGIMASSPLPVTIHLHNPYTLHRCGFNNAKQPPFCTQI